LHGSGHDHGLAHEPADYGRAFAIGVALNLGFVAVEGGYGIVANSVALIADAGHNLSDVLGLAVAWAAVHMGRRPPSDRFTYGLKGSSILAALLNALLLLVACGAIAWEAILRFSAPEPVAGGTVMAVAAIGIVVNGATAWLFARGRKGDINVRGAFLHMAADAGVSAAVVIAGLLIARTGLQWIDPVTSLLVVAVILWSTWDLLKDSVRLALAGVPEGVELAEVRASLAALPGVAGVHDLHVWPMGTSEIALTAHLVMPDGHPGDRFLSLAADDLHRRFGIGHATLQIELDMAGRCLLEPGDTV
jgi:cobalt-zinc-cadmium efflux system protein